MSHEAVEVHATNLNQAAYEVQQAADAVVAAVGAYVSAVDAQRNPEPEVEDVPQQPAESEGLSEVEKAEKRAEKKASKAADVRRNRAVRDGEPIPDVVVDGKTIAPANEDVPIGESPNRDNAVDAEKARAAKAEADAHAATSTLSFPQPVDQNTKSVATKTEADQAKAKADAEKARVEADKAAAAAKVRTTPAGHQGRTF